MSEAMFTIDARGAQIGEAIANGLTYDQIAGLFWLRPSTVKTHALRLYQALEITSNSSDGAIRSSKRAAAMLIAGGLLKPSDEKLPYRPYRCTMEADADALIAIKKARHTPCYNEEFIMPARGTAMPEDLTLDTLALTYLSCATWGMSTSRISQQYARGFYNSDKTAFNHVKYELGRACKLLDAVDVPQAIAHASFWGALEIDERVLDPALTEPPEYIVFEEDVVIPAEKFVRRLPPART